MCKNTVRFNLGLSLFLLCKNEKISNYDVTFKITKQFKLNA